MPPMSKRAAENTVLGGADPAGVSERAAQTVKPATGKRRPLADACPPSEFVTYCPRSDHWYDDHAECPECEGTKKVVRRDTGNAHFSAHIRSAPSDAPIGYVRGGELGS